MCPRFSGNSKQGTATPGCGTPRLRHLMWPSLVVVLAFGCEEFESAVEVTSVQPPAAESSSAPDSIASRSSTIPSFPAEIASEGDSVPVTVNLPATQSEPKSPEVLKAIKERQDRLYASVFSQSPRSYSVADTRRDRFGLETHDPPHDNYVYYEGSLFRELARQMLLLTVREEFRLPTRDESLLEEIAPTLSTSNTNSPRPPRTPSRVVPPASSKSRAANEPQDGDGPFGVLTLITTRDNLAEVFFFRRRDNLTIQTQFWRGEYRITPASPYESFVTQLEADSRTILPHVLVDLDYVRREPVWKESEDISETAKRALEEWDVVSQYAGLRRVHHEIASFGESPERLSALSQGYARMSELSYFSLGASRKVYLARALLYAERLVARTEGSPTALWNRAYVRTLVGLPALAAKDIKAVKEQEHVPPKWAPIIEAYVSGNVPELERLSEPQDEVLGAFLLWLNVFHRENLVQRSTALTRLMERSPESLYPLIATFQMLDSLGTKRIALEAAHRLPDLVVQQLRRQEDLPPAVREFIQQETEFDTNGLVKLVQLLRDAGQRDDRGEPSWEVLAQLIQDQIFQVAWGSGEYYVKVSWSRGDEMVQWANLLRGHPGELALRTFFIYGNSLNSMGKRFLAQIRFEQIEPQEEKYLKRGRAGDTKREFQLGNIISRHRDKLIHDIAGRLSSSYGAGNEVRQVETLFQIAPNHPATVDATLRHASERFPERIKSWEPLYQNDPEFVSNQGQAHLKYGRVTEAEASLLRSVELEPSYETYQALANFYSLANRSEEWIHAMETSLEYQVTGLEHTQTQTQLVDYFLALGQPQRAEPFGEGAATSYASWGLLSSAKVKEALGKWDEAEMLVRANAGRYSNQMFQWYYWCLRTGHGDLDAAREQAISQIDAYNGRFSDTYLQFQAGIILFFSGREADGYRLLAKCVRDDSNVYYQWVLLTVASISNNIEDRDRMLDELTKELPRNRQYLKYPQELVRHMKDCYESGDASKIDRDLMDVLIAQSPEKYQTSLWFHASQFLALHEREEDAERYLQLASGSPMTDLIEADFARHVYRELHQKSAPARDYEFVLPDELPNASGATILRHEFPLLGACTILDHENTVVTCDANGLLRFWDPAEGTLHGTLDVGSTLVRFDPAGNRCLVLIPGVGLRLWDLVKREQIAELPQPTGEVGNVWFDARHANRCFSTHRDLRRKDYANESLVYWDLETQTPIWRVSLDNRVAHVARTHPEREEVLVILRNNQNINFSFAESRSLADGKTLKSKKLEVHAVREARFSPDGSQLISIALNGQTVIWNTENWEAVHRFHKSETTALDFTSDGRFLLLGRKDKTIAVYRLEDKTLQRRISEHLRPSVQVGSSLDGEYFFSRGEDLSVRIWKRSQLLPDPPTEKYDERL